MAKPFDGDRWVSAGWRYSSGAGHFAYDYPMPIGTRLYAVGAGKIAASARGIPNDGPGDADYTNEPSNWVLLWTRWKNKPVSIFYQHLSPHVVVHTGQKVRDGQLLGFSGDSGNSSGPHLHLAAQWGWTYDRYRYMHNDGDNPYVIFPPSQLWKGDAMASLTDKEMSDFADRVAERVVRRLLGASPYGADAPKADQEMTVRLILRKLNRFLK